MGADGVLSVGPYYNKPSQEGHFQHYKAIAESADVPIIIYNIPGRTGVTHAARNPAEAGRDTQHRRRQGGLGGSGPDDGDPPQPPRRLQRSLPEDDSFAIPLMAMGGDGCISVVANQVPGLFAA